MPDLISEFSQKDGLPKRDEHDHYITDYNDASMMSELLYRYWYSTHGEYARLNLVDIGADEGVWGTAFSEVVDDLDAKNIRKWHPHKLAGIEKRITGRYTFRDEYPVVYDDWVVGDVLESETYEDLKEYSIAFGNPPYLKSKKQGELMTHLLWSLKQRFEICGFLLQTNYLASEQRYDAIFQTGLAVVAQSISRIHFEGRGKQQYREYAFYIWDQRYTQDMPQLTWFDANKQFIDPRFLAKYGGSGETR